MAMLAKRRKNEIDPTTDSDNPNNNRPTPIVVHINGVETAKLKDDPGRPKGHFALQMHSGNVMHVMFKDMKIRELP